MLQPAISKLLSNYTLGEMFSNKFGVRCYPATDNRTGIRYVVKILSIPYSETTTDAFLLSGAFSNKEDINTYYGNLAKDICRQAAILNALSQSPFFSHFTFCEYIPCENIGYEAVLVSPYQTTLATIFKKTKLTEDNILHLGISLCSALSHCRESGFIYIGIKPENIYLSESGEFTIGDIGFLPLSSLQYSVLNPQYHTIYTPSECHDCFSQVSENIDVYSVGILLCQAFSGGVLPDKPITALDHTRDDIKKVILKACSASESTRWKSPKEMAEALSACFDVGQQK